jgi:hypothetical protein
MATSPAHRRPVWLAVLAGLAAVLGFLNFLWFMAESSTIGDAGRGFIRDGHYYLVNAGVATEVSKAAWDWSVLHGRSILLTHPLALVGAAYLGFTVAFPAMLGVRPDPTLPARLARIVASGPRSATARMGARLGGVQLTRPLVRVDVHPRGIILAPFGLGQFGIDAADLIAVAKEQSFARGTRFRIEHDQAGTPDRIELYVDEDSPVLVAIRGLVPDAADRPSPRPGDASATAADEKYSTGMKAMLVTGLILSALFLAVALSSPLVWRLGPFGIAWAAVAVAIVGFNVWRFFIRDRHRW